MATNVGLNPEGLVEFVVRRRQSSFADAKDAWSQPPEPHRGKESKRWPYLAQEWTSPWHHPYPSHTGFRYFHHRCHYRGPCRPGLLRGLVRQQLRKRTSNCNAFYCTSFML